MKTLLFTAFCVFSLFSCEKKTESGKIDNQKSNVLSSNTSVKQTGADFLVKAYLILKDDFVKGNSKNAAASAKQVMVESHNLVKNFKKGSSEITDILNDISEHAEHISESADKMDHQREHFEVLSKDIEDLVKLKGYSAILYKDFCPMVNDSKGAYWLSADKEINNPYDNSAMKDCGEVKEIITAK